MTKTSSACWVILVAVLASPLAQAKNTRYAGVHPRTGKPNGGLCYVEAVHVHTLPPADERLYRHHEGVWIFVGDPTPFGWDGPKERYYGHHPVTVDVVLGSGDGVFYCSLDGPHYHAYAPPDDYKWVEKEDVHYYSGEYPPVYHQEKKRYSTVNVVYRQIHYERPVVVSPPPPEYHGPIIDVNVHFPVPAIGVHIGGPPPVVVRDHYVQPAPVVVHEQPRVIVVKEKHKKYKKMKHKKFKGWH